MGRWKKHVNGGINERRLNEGSKVDGTERKKLKENGNKKIEERVK